MAYDFTRLTVNQQALLSFCGWTIGCGRPQPSPATVKKLIGRGLVVANHVEGRPCFFVTEYTVPTAVHMAWCAHCTSKVKE